MTARLSLQRRIVAAVAVGVMLVVISLAVVVYLSVRSHLRGEVDEALASRAQPFLRAHEGGPDGRHGDGRPPHNEGTPGGGAPAGGPADRVPPPDRFGGAPGYFQFVDSSGHVSAPGGQALLPVDARVRRVATSGQGRYLTDKTVGGVHLRILTVADPSDHTAVQVARPLTEVDNVLDQLLYTFAIVIGAGVLLAALMGGLIGRAALAPIGRFIRRTEAVTGALDGSERLEEGDTAELARLAAGFNRTLDALERSVQAQRHLVADASHELRTPIAALRSNVQIFLDSERLPLDERRELQGAILAELDDLTQIVSDVVELARGAEPEARVERLHLDTIVRDAVARARRRSPELEFDVELEPTVIEHTHDRVARAVTNLVDNARKWSPARGQIEVRLRAGTLSVRDHGPGFDEADLPHVFDRFYRAPHARGLPGSGLGLAIVRQAAEARGGAASASNAPGGGAVVSARFGPAATVLDSSSTALEGLTHADTT